MKASLLNCLTAFKNDVPDAVIKMSSFCGVSLDSASRWNSDRLPQGNALNKLWYLFDAFGYNVSEVAELDPSVRILGEALAYDLVSRKELFDKLQISGSEQYLWRVLQGRLLPLSIRKGALSLESLAETKELVKLAKTEAHGNSIQSLSKVPKQAPRATPATALQTSIAGKIGAIAVADSQSNPSMIAVMAASQLGGLKPLLQYINKGGPNAIQSFRELVGDDEFYEVHDLLKSMSSRKAREFYQPDHS